MKQPALLTMALVACCLALVWLILNEFYISALVMMGTTGFIVYAIHRHILRSAHAMAQFIWSVRYSDFLSIPHQGEANLRALPPELLEEMTEALSSYKQNLQKKESKLQYFQALANHIDMTVLVYSRNGQMEWINEAARHLLKNDCMKTIDELTTFHPELPEKLRSLKAGDVCVLQVRKEEETIQLALSGMEFILQGRPLTVASMKNIHSVLDSQETEAWQKLIRVLTHEIMNSITPISSLSELLVQQLDNFNGNSEEREEIRQMLQTIHRRGDELIRFVNSYREVSHLPQPVLNLYSTTELLTGALQLMQTEKDDIRLVTSSTPLRIVADKDLIEQVLINLIRNARENEAEIITLSSEVAPGNRPFLRVEDNGTGIEAEVLERIFIPFFTTKPTGSGIGLTISRQIMHLHHGNITATSHTPNQKHQEYQEHREYR